MSEAKKVEIALQLEPKTVAMLKRSDGENWTRLIELMIDRLAPSMAGEGRDAPALCQAKRPAATEFPMQEPQPWPYVDLATWRLWRDHLDTLEVPNVAT